MKISVIIPCYNVPDRFVEQAVLSAIEQDFTDYEILIIDDGSQQEYHNYLQKIAQEYQIIKLITIENHGVSSARNTGTKYAHGDYITFLDADDILYPGFLKEAYRVALETNADFIIGGRKTAREIKDIKKEADSSVIKYCVYEHNDVKGLKIHFISYYNPIRFSDAIISRGPWGRIIKREIALKNAFLEKIKIGEDILWNLELLSCCNKVVIVYKIWYLYRQNPLSVMHKYNPDIFNIQMETTRLLCNYIDLEDDEYYKCYMEYLYEAFCRIWNCFLRYSNNGKLESEIRANLYKNPWKKLASKRFIKSASFKMKIFSILYKLHLSDLFFKVRLLKRHDIQIFQKKCIK